METIQITTEFIKLQDLMKLADLVGSGGEAKVLILDGQVSVGGEICLQRGRKLRPADDETVRSRDYTVAYAP